jgi:hypothetical protein
MLLLGGCILREAKAKPEPLHRPLPVATRFARLTHAQWANTVRDLFEVNVADELEASLRPDPNPNGFLFDNYAASLSVDNAMWRDYQRVASEIAKQVASDPRRLAKLLPDAGGAASARARELIVDFGAKVHRRPLTAEQVQRYLEVFEAGPAAYPELGAAGAGVRLVLEAFLQSPHFLYRIEGHGPSHDGQIRLDAHDLASRLSYTLWNTLPDADIFARAASGELEDPAGLARVAASMLDDPRAEAMVLSFHSQLLERDRLKQAAPSPARFGELSENFTAHAARESDLFIKHHVLEQNHGYKELLSSSNGFVNRELASIYGVDGTFGDEFTQVSFDPARRRGLLTQTAFLAAHATSLDPDPIHRGVFVARRLLCVPLRAPGSLPPLPAAGGRTNRQTVEAHTETEGSGCAVCHKRTINPLGFPFESYDAIGRERALDNGLPVDPSSVATLDGEPVSVKDGVELAQRIAESPQAHACYARHWLEYAYGRPATARDGALISQLGAESVQGKLSIKGLILQLLAAPQFASIDERDL